VIRRLAAGVALAVLVVGGFGAVSAQPHAAATAEPPKVIDLSSAPKVIDIGERASGSFDSLWEQYKRADDSGDVESSVRALHDIRWYRTERNVRSLDGIALSLVGRGVGRLKKGEVAKAEDDFKNAITLDPHLADGYYGLARASVAGGLVGVFAGLGYAASAVVAPLGTANGSYFLLCFLVSAGLLTLLVVTSAFAITMVLRHGALLRHDVEEALGPGSQTVALGVYIVFLLVPLMTLQGYGWLPFWSLAVLFLYMSGMEKALAGLLVAVTLAIGPGTRALEAYGLAEQNPLLHASLASIEGGPDTRAIADLAAGIQTYPDDRDLKYLLALQYKKAGRYDESAAIYREIVESTTKDKDPIDLGIALNNLGNIDFARGQAPSDFLGPSSRYKRAAELQVPSDMTATFYYNLSLAHLQGFQYDPANEARSQADRLDRGLTQEYEGLWKAERRGSAAVSAVVDLMPSRDEVWAKFIDTRDGVAQKNVTHRGASPIASMHLIEAAFNRFTGFLVLFAAVTGIVWRIRGDRMVTARCGKCGTPFCRKCQLTESVSGLCTQCHHLFVVRDGVSGPARSKKLAEVQEEEARRNRVFRVLALALPGAGQMYGDNTIVGFGMNLIWCALLATLVLGGRTVPITQTPQALAGWWTTAVLLLALLVIYVLSYRLRPNFEYIISAAQRPPRRMVQAQAS
jgi:tetratricopeptide (TPR) repeat protein